MLSLRPTGRTDLSAASRSLGQPLVDPEDRGVIDPRLSRQAQEVPLRDLVSPLHDGFELPTDDFHRLITLHAHTSLLADAYGPTRITGVDSASSAIRLVRSSAIRRKAFATGESGCLMGIGSPRSPD